MTNNQLKYLRSIFNLLEDVQSDKRIVYPMAIINETGRHEYLASREEYLDHIISVVTEELVETFPQLEDEN